MPLLLGCSKCFCTEAALDMHAKRKHGDTPLAIIKKFLVQKHPRNCGLVLKVSDGGVNRWFGKCPECDDHVFNVQSRATHFKAKHPMVDFKFAIPNFHELCGIIRNEYDIVTTSSDLQKKRGYPGAKNTKAKKRKEAQAQAEAENWISSDDDEEQ